MWTEKTLKDCLTERFARKAKLLARDYLPKGELPVVDQGQELISGYTNDRSLEIAELPVIIFGDHTRIFKYIDFPFAVGADGTQILQPKSDILPKYFYYYCSAIEIPNRGYNRHFSYLKETLFKYPDITNQSKLVTLLDSFQRSMKINESAILETEKLKSHVISYVFENGFEGRYIENSQLGKIPEDNSVLSVEELMHLGALNKPIDGNHGSIHPKASDYVESGIPFVMACDLVNGKIDFKRCNYISKVLADGLQKGFALAGDVLISHKGTIGRTAIVENTKHEYIMLTPQVTYYRVEDDNILSRNYLKVYFDSVKFQKIIKQIAGDGSTRAYIGITRQQQLPILVPPIVDQLKIVKVAHAFDKKLELLRQKYTEMETAYRYLLDRLLDQNLDVSKISLHEDLENRNV